jgi:dephospho-CoA kinase
MRVIGITGGIGTGKTTVCNFLQELGATVLDLDLIGHESYKKDTLCYGDLVAAFGAEVLLQDGEIDRKKLGAIVFADEVERKKLNAIVWPAMRMILQENLRKSEEQRIQIVVLEAAVLIEAGWQDVVNELWVVDASREKVRERVKERDGLSDEEISKRIAAQYPQEVLMGYADAVVNTDCSLEELREKIVLLWGKMVGVAT